MSYARWSPDSDVYVYLRSDGLICEACALNPLPADAEPVEVTNVDQASGVMSRLLDLPPLPPATILPTYSQMVAHLHLHRASGHLVPEYSLDALARDAASDGDDAVAAAAAIMGQLNSL